MLNISLAYYDNATQELCWLFATSSIVRNLNKLYSMMSGFMHLMHNFCSCCLQFQPSQAVHLFFNVHKLQFSWQLYAFSVWFLAAKWALLQNKLQISNFSPANQAARSYLESISSLQLLAKVQWWRLANGRDCLVFTFSLPHHCLAQVQAAFQVINAM